MKKLFFSLLLLPAIGVNAQTIYPSGAQNLVARYDFSTTANSGMQLTDVSNNGHTGNIFNTFSTAGWRGQSNTAMKFNGQSSYVQVAHTSLLAPQTITLVGLVRYDGFWDGPCQGNAIVEKGYPWANSGTYSLFCSDQAYDNNCSAFDSLHQTTGADLGHATYTPPVIPPFLEAGQWYFVAASYDGSNVSIYQQKMDSTSGVPTSLSPIYTTATNGSIGFNTMDVLLGRTFYPPHPYWFNGAMDEVAIFNRGLQSDEVFSIYKYLWGTPLAVENISASVENTVQARTNAGQLYLTSTDGKAIGDVNVYNIAGQKIVADKFNNNSATLDLSTFPKEILFIKIVRNGTAFTLKASNL